MGSGRQEHERAIEQQTIARIDNQLVLRFYNSLDICTPNTKKQYISTVLEFVDWYEEKEIEIFDEELSRKVTADDLHKFMDNMQKTKHYEVVTLQRKLVTLNTFFLFLKRSKIINENPIDFYGKRLKDHSEKEVVSLTKEELQVLWNNIKNSGTGWKVKRDYALFVLMFTTGLRVSATDEINVGDIDFEKGVVNVVEKLNKRRVVPIPQKTILVIKEWIEERQNIMGSWVEDVDALFVTKYKNSWQRMSIRGIQDLYKKYAKGIDKKISPHKARSTFGTMLYQETEDIYLVAEVLGQSSVEATKRYIKNSNERRSQAIDKIAQLMH